MGFSATGSECCSWSNLGGYHMHGLRFVPGNRTHALSAEQSGSRELRLQTTGKRKRKTTGRRCHSRMLCRSDTLRRRLIRLGQASSDESVLTAESNPEMDQASQRRPCPRPHPLDDTISHILHHALEIRITTRPCTESMSLRDFWHFACGAGSDARTKQGCVSCSPSLFVR